MGWYWPGSARSPGQGRPQRRVVNRTAPSRTNPPLPHRASRTWARSPEAPAASWTATLEASYLKYDRNSGQWAVTSETQLTACA